MHMQEPHSWYANSKNVSLFGVWIMVFDTKTFEQFPFALYYGLLLWSVWLLYLPLLMAVCLMAVRLKTSTPEHKTALHAH